MSSFLSQAATHSLEIEARELASLIGAFRPSEIAECLSIRQDDVLRRHALWRALSMMSVENTNGPTYGWSLLPDARREGLSVFFATSHIARAVAQSPKPRLDDDFGRALRRLMTGQRIELPSPGTKADDDKLHKAQRQLAAVLDAAQFAVAAPALTDQTYIVTGPMPEAHMTLQRLIDFLKDQIKHLQTRRNIKMVLPHEHHGYSGLRNRISGHLRSISQDPRPQLLTGIGGVGKSALIARLLQGWSHAGHDIVPIVLDFDRHQLSAGEPVEIMTEIIRQLSAAINLDHAMPTEKRDTIEANLSDIRSEIALWKRDLEGNLETNLMQSSYLQSTLHRFEDDWAAPLRDLKIAVFFDTFEAVARMGVFAADSENEGELPDSPVIEQILQLENAIRQIAFPKMRSLFSGREPPVKKAASDQFFSHVMRARGLTSGSGARLLAVEDEKIADKEGTKAILTSRPLRVRVSKLLSGHPLALLVFARYAHRHADDVEALIADLEKEGGFGAALAQQFLYTRILARVKDDKVRALAHPGLVLRKLNSDMVRLVLAEPCLGISADEMTSEQANDLMSRLADEYWLVEPDAGAFPLRHRPDLRGLMVRGIFAGPADRDDVQSAERKTSLREKAIFTARNAANYFANGPAREDSGHDLWAALNKNDRTLEATYYQAFYEPPPDNFESRLARRLRHHLGDDIETMPIAWRARLKLGCDMALTQWEEAALSDSQREEAAQKSFRVSKQSGLSGAKSRIRAKPAARAPQGRGEVSFRQMAYDISIAWAQADFSALPTAMEFLEVLKSDPKRTEVRFSPQPWNTPQYRLALAYSADPDQASDLEMLVGDRDLMNIAEHAFASIEMLAGRRSDEMMRRFLKDDTVDDAVSKNRLNGGSGMQAIYGNPSSEEPVELSPAAMSLAYMRKVDEDDSKIADRKLFKMEQLVGRLIGEFAIPLLDGRDDLTTSKFEQAYRRASQNVVQFSADVLSDLKLEQRDDFARILRGLSPELYEPAASVMEAMELGALVDILSQVENACPTWPRDLSEQVKPSDIPRQALSILETADRCGVMEVILAGLADASDSGQKLAQMHKVIGERFFGGPLYEKTPT